MGVLLFALFVPWAIAEGVWWLSRKGNTRTRSQQMADLGRLVVVHPFNVMSPPWIWAMVGIALALVALLMVLFAPR